MTVETATLISDLNASYPSATDPKSEGDNHIRLIKSALKATFPNFTDVVLANQAQINHSVGVTSPIQTQLDGKLSKSGGAVIGDVSITGATTLNGDVTHTGNYSQTGTHSVAGQITSVNSTVRAYNVASSAYALLSAGSVTVDYLAANGVTRDLTLRGAYHALAPIPEGTVTIPSQLIAESDIQATGSGKRFKADFSNATVANRLMFQTSTSNGATRIAAIPNGTGNTSSIAVINNSDPTNSSWGQLSVTGTAVVLASTISGTGTLLPLEVWTGGAKGFDIATDGTFASVRGAIGYGTGAGGTVTQATSKSTAVTLNKPSGTITMHNAALAAGASVTFLVNNSFAGSIDGIVLNQVSGYANFNSYDIKAEAILSGGFYITVKNVFGSSLSEALTISFKVIKGANA